jgi:hypothetical protein
MATIVQASTTSAVAHRNVYLDQSAYGAMRQSGDWRSSKIGAALLHAQNAGTAQIWAGPTNVIETIQASNIQTRKEIASLMLELIEAKRMWWGHEFEVIEDFFLFLERFAPGAIRHRDYFRHYGDVARQTWLGALALTAATGGPHFGPIIDSLRHTKTMNQLIHARFALNPGDWVASMADAAKELKTAASDPLAELERMSTEEMENEIKRLQSSTKRLDKSTLEKLNKNRDTIAKAYGAIEIGAMLGVVFKLPFDLELTLDIPRIVSRWNEIQTATGCEPLPKYIREADESRLCGDSSIAIEVIQLAIRASARRGLLTTSIGVHVILREMQQCMNANELPTGGLAFDADHAVALTRHEVFVTHDERLAGTLKTMAKVIEKTTGGKCQPEVVTTARQLEQVLARPVRSDN